jgi:hypothetical protein
MGWDAEDSENYRKISESLSAIAETIAGGESDRPLVKLLVGISSSYAKLADYFRAREETAHLRCEPGAIETEADRRASLEMRDLYNRLREQWAALAAEMDTGASPKQR